MSRSSDRTLGIKDIPEHERHISERFRLQGEAWATAKADAWFHEKFRESAFERMKATAFQTAKDLGEKISLSEAGRRVLISDEWQEYLMLASSKMELADKQWVLRKAIEMAHEQSQERNRDARAERFMGRAVP